MAPGVALVGFSGAPMREGSALEALQGLRELLRDLGLLLGLCSGDFLLTMPYVRWGHETCVGVFIFLLLIQLLILIWDIKIFQRF